MKVHRYEIWFLYGLVVLYSMSYQLQSPVEIFLVEKLTKDSDDLATAYGRLRTCFSLISVFSSLIFGKILDRYGLQIGFILVFVACAATFGIMSIADSMNHLYLSKIPAIFHAGFLAAQSCAIKLTKPGEERIVVLGRLVTSYTIGGVVGPALGGWLASEGDYYVGARVSVGISLFAAAICTFRFPRSLQDSNDRTVDVHTTPNIERRQGMSFLAVAATVWPFLLVRTSTSTALSMAKSVQNLVLKDKLGLTKRTWDCFNLRSMPSVVLPTQFLDPSQNCSVATRSVSSQTV